ncbi:MAG TPA: hypoxanthine phosphoribosyltransferase [Kiritimatiellae bacterium]|nr:hypoxanthine phosphoribosyltransferase [Kiritimatiellia bacterium]
MHPHHILRVLFTADDIAGRVDALVGEIGRTCAAGSLVLVGILRGSFIFFADLVRGLFYHHLHPRIDFTLLQSYGSGTESSGTVEIERDISVDVRGTEVVLVDDILDTGRTLHFAVELMYAKGARSVKSCVLLDKPSRRVAPISADFVGFTVEDVFVVGYGLDYDSYYRELPYIAELTFTHPGAAGGQ